MNSPARIPWITLALGLGFGIGAVAVLPSSWLWTDAPRVATVHDAEHWACPMQCVVLDGPGICPVCGMALERLDAAGAQLALDAREREAMQLVVEPVQLQALTRTLRAFGRVELNERHVRTVTAWAPGRVERLYANNAYTDIRQGDHLLALYSPELAAAQRELLSAGAPSSALHQSAQERLRRLGLLPSQIEELLERRTVNTTIDLPSPVSGKIVDIAIREGQWVQEGSKLFTVADFDSFWLQFDAYERDLPWIVVGQPVRVLLEAWPGRAIPGTVSFIDEAVARETLTVKVRVVMDNTDGLIKRGMQALVEVDAAIGPDGRVAAPSLKERYWCYMHPEIRRSAPEACSVCGMPLELHPERSPKSSPSERPTPVLAVRRSAILDTGERHIVYVQSAPAQFEERGGVQVESEPARFELREITVGPRAGAWSMVMDGLQPGELVAVSGALLVDSQMELSGQPSLLLPQGRAQASPPPAHDHGTH